MISKSRPRHHPGCTMTNYDDTDQMISEFHELLHAEQERDPDFGWDTSKQRFKPDEPTAEPNELPTAPQIRPLAEVEERPISWLWPGHLALGRLTVVAGEPGAGASLLLLEVASRVSRGRSFPPRAFPGAKQDANSHKISDVSHEAAEVLLITRQDAAEVVKPRLASLGADTKKFHLMGDVPDVTFIRYLAAAKNTLADMDDALSFETPEGRVVWGRRPVSAAVCWATAARLDQEDAARWLRDELAVGPKTAKELRAAADEAGIPWHVVYRAKGIAGADCGRVGGGTGSYFVWSLYDLVEEAEEAEESAKSSIAAPTGCRRPMSRRNWRALASRYRCCSDISTPPCGGEPARRGS